jgi:gliding motility-associated-like protein
MLKPAKYILALIIVFSCTLQFKLLAQLFAPNRNWSTVTQYVRTDQQDSVFLFFPLEQTALRAQFSDSSAATYKWFKYSDNLPVDQRFQLLPGETDSTIIAIDRGGYMVEAKRISDDSLETYIVWMMIDDVELSSLSVSSNNCQMLELVVSTSPNYFEIFSLFAYYDLSLPTHQEKNILSASGYFGNHLFESLNTQVQVSPVSFGLPFIFVEFDNELNGQSHGPLQDAAYKFTVTTPFGRGDLVAETPDISAISTKVNFDIYFNLGDDLLPDWQKQTDDFPSAEALLEIKLESTAENADSIFWNIINDEIFFQKGADSILWQDSSLFSISVEAFPPKKKMYPGIYQIEHISKKWTNGVLCKDTLLKTIEVDTSFINPASIPNVFSPNGDGTNDFFLIKDVETSIVSIREFRISIMSRWGKVVYVYTGEPKTWEGWNGKIDGTKGDAAEGVYFFVIEAVGWDGRRYRDGAYKGFLHLYR